MTYTMNRITMVSAAAALVVAGLGGGYWWAQRRSDHDMAMAGPPETSAGERKALRGAMPATPPREYPDVGIYHPAMAGQ